MARRKQVWRFGAMVIGTHKKDKTLSLHWTERGKELGESLTPDPVAARILALQWVKENFKKVVFAQAIMTLWNTDKQGKKFRYLAKKYNQRFDLESCVSKAYRSRDANEKT